MRTERRDRDRQRRSTSSSSNFIPNLITEMIMKRCDAAMASIVCLLLLWIDLVRDPSSKRKLRKRSMRFDEKTRSLTPTATIEVFGSHS
jgi:hypothetical protein